MRCILAIVSTECKLTRLETSELQLSSGEKIKGTWMASTILPIGCPIIAMHSPPPTKDGEAIVISAAFAIFPHANVPLCGHESYPSCAEFVDEASDYVDALCNAKTIIEICIRRLTIAELRSNEKMIRRWQTAVLDEALIRRSSYEDIWDFAVKRLKRDIQEIPTRKKMQRSYKMMGKNKYMAEERKQAFIETLDQAIGFLKS